MTEFLDLNDNCLDRIFDFCDVKTNVTLSEVCVRFNSILEQWQFPKQAQFQFCIRSDECEENASKIIKCIGMHLVDLSIIYHQTSNPFPFYRCVSSFVGPRIRKLSIHSLKLSETSIGELGPVLPHIEELEVRTTGLQDCDDIDLTLRSRCPNLRKLLYLCNTPFIQNALAWPRLENLSLGYNITMNQNTFVEFMQNNRQLRTLKIRANRGTNLKDIADNLLNLRELTIFSYWTSLCPEKLIELRKLTDLQRIALRFVKHSNFNQILETLPELNTLIDIRIQAEDDIKFKPNAESVISVARLCHDCKCLAFRIQSFIHRHSSIFCGSLKIYEKSICIALTSILHHNCFSELWKFANHSEIGRIH